MSAEYRLIGRLPYRLEQRRESDRSPTEALAGITSLRSAAGGRKPACPTHRAGEVLAEVDLDVAIDEG